MPTVDVIIGAYNAAQYLPFVIESVITQTLDSWRIILVDDGSTDNTAEVVHSFVQRLGGKLKYLKQRNQGPSAARNAAIRNSSAEFLALLDADDVWLPNRLSESLKPFEVHPEVGLTYARITRIDYNGTIIETPQADVYPEGRVAPYIYTRRLHLPCPTITFRRACIEKVGLFDESMRQTEDRDLWFRIAELYDVGFVPKVLAYYRVSPNSNSADPDQMLRAQVRFIEKHYGRPGCGLRAKNIGLSTAYKERAEVLSRRGQPRIALSSATRALLLDPFETENFRTAGSLLLKYIGLKR